MKTYNRKFKFSSKDDDEEILNSMNKKDSHVEESNTGSLIYFYSDVTRNRVLELNKALRQKQDDAIAISVDYRLPEPPPIWIHINSPGGACIDALAAMDCVNSIKKRVSVNTVIEGECSSAATLISIVGTRRYMHENAMCLIHQISVDGVWGTYEQLKDFMSNTALLTNKITDLYHKYTKINEETLQQLLKRDLFLDAKTALDFGIIDEII